MQRFLNRRRSSRSPSPRRLTTRSNSAQSLPTMSPSEKTSTATTTTTKTPSSKTPGENSKRFSEKIFLDAARQGNTAQVLSMLQTKLESTNESGEKIETKFDVNCSNSKSWTALHMASYNGHVAVIRVLVELGGADLWKRQKEQWAAIHLAVQNNHLSIVQYLLSVDPNLASACQQNGWSPLHLACQAGNLDIVECLIEKGANVDARRKFGWTSLHIAAQNGFLPISQYLVQHGAELEPRDHDGWTPLYVASQNGHVDIVEFLLKSGAGVDVKDRHRGTTPLHASSQRGHLEVVKLLLDHGADMEAPVTVRRHSFTAQGLAHATEQYHVSEYLDTRNKQRLARKHASKEEQEQRESAVDTNGASNEKNPDLSNAQEEGRVTPVASNTVEASEGLDCDNSPAATCEAAVPPSIPRDFALSNGDDILTRGEMTKSIDLALISPSSDDNDLSEVRETMPVVHDSSQLPAEIIGISQEPPPEESPSPELGSFYESKTPTTEHNEVGTSNTSKDSFQSESPVEVSNLSFANNSPKQDGALWPPTNGTMMKSITSMDSLTSEGSWSNVANERSSRGIIAKGDQEDVSLGESSRRSAMSMVSDWGMSSVISKPPSQPVEEMGQEQPLEDEKKHQGILKPTDQTSNQEASPMVSEVPVDHVVADAAVVSLAGSMLGSPPRELQPDELHQSRSRELCLASLEDNDALHENDALQDNDAAGPSMEQVLVEVVGLRKQVDELNATISKRQLQLLACFCLFGTYVVASGIGKRR